MGLIQKTKAFLGFDIKEDKYALVDDPIFGKVAKDKAPEKSKKIVHQHLLIKYKGELLFS